MFLAPGATNPRYSPAVDVRSFSFPEIVRCPGNCTCYMNESALVDVTNEYEEYEQMMTTICIDEWNETTFDRIAKTTDYL